MIRLLKELSAGNTAELDTFYQEASRQGTPLIEPLEGDDKYALVTFLWFAPGVLKNVVLISEVVGGWWRNGFSESRLFRMQNTNLYYRSYHVLRDARFRYRLSPNDSLVHPEEVDVRKERRATITTDPLNPNQQVIPKNDEDPNSIEQIWSTVEMPAAPPQPWLLPRPEVQSGHVQLHRFRSEILDNERRIWVYTPPNYAPQGNPYPMLLLFDGWMYTEMTPTPTILDNMLAFGHLPPLIAVIIDNTFNRSRELNGYSSFNAFLVRELIPWVGEKYNVTSDRADTIVRGISLGGVAAVFAGLEHPEIFGNVLSQSGAFWLGKEGKEEDEWLATWVAERDIESDKSPLRFYLEAGLMENQRDLPGTNILRSTRHLRNVLRAKGYAVHYAEFSGGHTHLSWPGTFSDGLLALIGKAS